MNKLNTFLVVLNLAIVGLGCESEPDNLTTTPQPPVGVPPDIHGSPTDAAAPAALDWQRVPAAKPMLGDVELRQSKLDTNPTMGTCPVWGVSASQAWVMAYKAATPLDQPTEQNRCRLIPPNSTYPNLYDSANTYPNSELMNDNIRTLITWVRPGNCVRLTVKQHPDWWQSGGQALTYQLCATTQDTVLTANIEADGGAGFGVTQVRVDWWTQ